MNRKWENVNVLQSNTTYSHMLKHRKRIIAAKSMARAESSHFKLQDVMHGLPLPREVLGVCAFAE